MNTAKDTFFGWVPQVIPHEGIDRLMNWIRKSALSDISCAELQGFFTRKISSSREKPQTSKRPPNQGFEVGEPRMSTKSEP